MVPRRLAKKVLLLTVVLLVGLFLWWTMHPDWNFKPQTFTCNGPLSWRVIAKDVVYPPYVPGQSFGDHPQRTLHIRVMQLLRGEQVLSDDEGNSNTSSEAPFTDHFTKLYALSSAIEKANASHGYNTDYGVFVVPSSKVTVPEMDEAVQCLQSKMKDISTVYFDAKGYRPYGWIEIQDESYARPKWNQVVFTCGDQSQMLLKGNILNHFPPAGEKPSTPGYSPSDVALVAPNGKMFYSQDDNGKLSYPDFDISRLPHCVDPHGTTIQDFIRTIPSRITVL